MLHLDMRPFIVLKCRRWLHHDMLSFPGCDGCITVKSCHFCRSVFMFCSNNHPYSVVEVFGLIGLRSTGLSIYEVLFRRELKYTVYCVSQYYSQGLVITAFTQVCGVECVRAH